MWSQRKLKNNPVHKEELSGDMVETTSSVSKNWIWSIEHVLVFPQIFTTNTWLWLQNVT